MTDERIEIGVTVERFSRFLLGDGQHEYGSDNPALNALFDARTIQDFITDELPRLSDQARKDGASWQLIADQLGVSRQSAWERFSGSGGWNKGLKETRVTCPTCGEKVAKSWLARHDAKYH